MRSLAAVARAAEKPFSVEYIDLPEPAEDEILVEIAAVGVCHTDIACRNQVMPVPLPSILGHEGAGIVQQVGSRVTKVKPGDHVVLTYYSCGICKPCQIGEPSYCTQFHDYNFGFNPAIQQIATGEHDEAIRLKFFGQSSFAQYALVRERSAVKIRSDVPLRIAAPLGCGVMTGAGTVICGLKARAGASIAIFGAGSVGLSSVFAAVLSGCSKIIVIDVIDSRLEMAQAFGATHTINGTKYDLSKEIRKIIPNGVDFAVDNTAVPSVIRHACSALAARGTLGLVGGRGPEDDLVINYEQVMAQGLIVRGFIEGHCIPDVFIPQLVELYMQGRFPFDKMITFYPFERINDAVADQLAGKIIKPVLEMQRQT
ncbi:MAG: NAD(P)-dependent alcohol dehydrogenase [Candidatus Korobacteraceae bacterium]|jgi:aryl-alcohol dehydrogenase